MGTREVAWVDGVGRVDSGSLGRLVSELLAEAERVALGGGAGGGGGGGRGGGVVGGEDECGREEETAVVMVEEELSERVEGWGWKEGEALVGWTGRSGERFELRLRRRLGLESGGGANLRERLEVRSLGGGGVRAARVSSSLIQQQTEIDYRLNDDATQAHLTIHPLPPSVILNGCHVWPPASNPPRN